MNVFKRIVASFSVVVITFVTFAIPAAPVAEAGVIEDTTYVYTESNLLQFLLHRALNVLGGLAGGFVGTVTLPGIGSVEGTAVGVFLGELAAAGIDDLAEYYAAGYTDEDFEEAYLASLPENGFGGTSGRIPVSSDDGFYDCTSLLMQGALGQVTHDYFASGNTLRVAYGGVNATAVPVHAGYDVMVNATSSYDIKVALWCFTASGWQRVLDHQSISSAVGASDYSYYDTGWLDPGTTVTIPEDTVCIWLNSKRSDNGALTVSNIQSFSLLYELSGSGNTGDRLGLYMEELDAWNQNNSYLDNQYTPNYYITPDNGDTLYSPVVFSESTKVFTEPNTGNQYLCTKWTYYYSEDDTLHFNGASFFEGDYLGSYILSMADNSYYVDGIEIPIVWIIYCTDAVVILPTYIDDENALNSVGHGMYSYVVVSQTNCGVGNHDMTWEITQDPTCTSTGTEVGTCSICGKSSTYELDKLEHTYKSSVTQQATCTVPGVMTYTCTACGNEYTETIAATGVHAYKYSVMTSPTCTTEGTARYSCSVCGNQYTEPIAATGHIDQILEIVSSVYDDEGIVQSVGYTVYECTVCGYQHRVNDEIAGENQGLISGLTSIIVSFAKAAWSAIASGIGKLFSGFADLLGGIFGFFTDTVIGGVKSFFGILSDDSILGYYQDDTGAAALPEGVGSAMAMIPAFFGGLPAELQAPVIFGIAALFLIAALKLFL